MNEGYLPGEYFISSFVKWFEITTAVFLEISDFVRGEALPHSWGIQFSLKKDYIFLLRDPL